MDLDIAVCSLEYANKLKELGINKLLFTVAELFEMLPAFIDTKKDEPFNNFYFHLVKRPTKAIQYIVNYYCDTHQLQEGIDPFFATSLIQHNIYDEKLSDALAKLLIVLLERGLVTIITKGIND